MAKNVVIRDVVYQSVPSVTIPLSGETGNANFYDISDATIDSNAKMLDGVVAYGSTGTKYTGNIATKTSSDLTASGATVTVPAGYYASQVTKDVATGSVTMPSSISTAGGTAHYTTHQTLVVTASATATPDVTTAGYISTGSSGECTLLVDTTIQALAAATITPTTSDQTIAAGKFTLGAQTISGDANLVASNIVSGVSIFGVNGTAQIPVISQDSTTKVLSIS